VDVDKLRGIAIVSVSEGAKLGTVSGALFDPASLRLTALDVKGGAGRFIIPLGQIKAFGADAVTVESSSVTQVQGESGASTEVSLDTLRKRKVVDEEGTLLGTLHSLDIESVSGDVESIVVHKGGILGLGGESHTIPAAAIKSIGTDLITVTSISAPAE
jgi:sporulation protein YlmC with PRC-barrel domain